MTKTGTSRKVAVSGRLAARGAEAEARCLRCGCTVPIRPRGCKGARCSNCGHPYPLGDCSD